MISSPNGRPIRSQRGRAQKLTMTQAEASQSIQRMQGLLVDLSQELSQFIRRQGWKSLGYATPEQCLEERLSMTYDGARRRILAATCKGQLASLTPDSRLQAFVWKMADSCTRPLLTLNDPQARMDAVVKAERISAKTGTSVTATALAGIVQKMQKPTRGARPAPAAAARSKCPMCRGSGWLSTAIVPA